MVNVGIEYLIGGVLLSGGAIFHSWEVNDLSNVSDFPAYVKALPKYDRFLAKATSLKVMGGTFIAAFLASVALLSIPVVGAYLAILAGGALLYDTFKVKGIKKALVEAENDGDFN